MEVVLANPKLRFFFREPTIDTNLPFTDGTISVEGFDLTVSTGEWDAIDHAFGALVEAKEAGTAGVSIPAYPNRKFRQSYIQVRSDAGITSAKDLEGRRVGILAWANSAGVWIRGALQNYYSVDLTTIDWVAVQGFEGTLPDGIRIENLPKSTGGPDQLLDKMLLDGAVDAVLFPNVLPSISAHDPRTRRLFTDYRTEEQKYYRETGIFPISHVVTLKREFVEKYPHAPVALLEAYRRARDEALNRIEGSDPVVLTISWAAVNLAEQRELMGERYWPYNLEDNRRSLEAMLEYSYQQGITKTKLNIESFFDPAARTLPGF